MKFKPLAARAVANYSEPKGQCSPNDKSTARAIQMRIDDDQGRPRSTPLLPGQLRAQAGDQNPTIPGALREVLRGARGHHRMQHPGRADIPRDARTQPPKPPTDRP